MKEIEILQNSIATLNNIYVPCGLTEQIAIPIAKVVDALMSLVQEKMGQEKQDRENSDGYDVKVTELEPVAIETKK